MGIFPCELYDAIKADKSLIFIFQCRGFSMEVIINHRSDNFGATVESCNFYASCLSYPIIDNDIKEVSTST